MTRDTQGMRKAGDHEWTSALLKASWPFAGELASRQSRSRDYQYIDTAAAGATSKQRRHAERIDGEPACLIAVSNHPSRFGGRCSSGWPRTRLSLLKV